MITHQLRTPQETLATVALIAVVTAVSLHIYAAQILGSAIYYRSLQFDLALLPFHVCAAAAIVLLIPHRIKAPTDLFIFFQLAFIVLSFAALSSGKIQLTLPYAMAFLALLVLPSLLAHLLRGVNFPMPGWLDTGTSDKALLERFVLVLTLALVALVVVNAPEGSSLDFSTLYDRRIAARSSVSRPIAYAMQVSGNGLIPMLAFLYGFRRRYLGIVVCISLDLGLYYVDGSKGLFAYTFAAFGLGLLLSAKRPTNLVLLCLGAVALIYVAVLIEGFPSNIAEYIYRRIFIIPGIGTAAYIEAFFQGNQPHWALWDGMLSGEAVTYYVGRVIYGFPDNNANTSAFVYALADGGIWLLARTVLVVLVIYRLLDTLHARTRDPIFVFVGFQYGILLVEQGAFTALVSSGMALVLAIAVIFSVAGGMQARGLTVAARPPTASAIGNTTREN
jgi:hypothetical protein